MTNLPTTTPDDAARGEGEGAPPGDGARRARFGAWCVSVVFILCAPVWARLLGPGAGPLVAGAHALAGLTALVALLRTTPPDAIRLSWRAGAVLIALVAVALPLLAGAPGAPRTGAIALLASALTLAILTPPRAGVSPWWVAPGVWHPGLWLLWGPSLWSGSAGAGGRTGLLLGQLAMLGGLGLAFAFVNAWRPNAFWALWAASAGVALVGLAL